MKVEDIKKMKSGKYKVTIDGEQLVTYDDVILNNHLLYQKEIDEEAFQKILQDNEISDIYNKTLRYALKKVRSTKEIKEFLKKFDISFPKEEEIIDHLKKIGVLSDLFFAKAYISDHFYLSNDGPKKIYEELKSHDIEESLIEEELSKLDEAEILEKLTKLIMKKISHDHKHSSYQLKQKVIIDMVNLGYDRDMIQEILSTVSIEDHDKLEKEYQILFHKLERKYEGKELERKIQEKLYSKGFDIHQIENLMAQKKSEFI